MEKKNKRKTSKAMSFRWRPYEYNLLKKLIEDTQEVSGDYPMDATKLMRGLILLASKQNPEILRDAILEAEKESLISNF